MSMKATVSSWQSCGNDKTLRKDSSQIQIVVSGIRVFQTTAPGIVDTTKDDFTLSVHNISHESGINLIENR